jgi:hypothetical protein
MNVQGACFYRALAIAHMLITTLLALLLGMPICSGVDP